MTRAHVDKIEIQFRLLVFQLVPDEKDLAQRAWTVEQLVFQLDDETNGSADHERNVTEILASIEGELASVLEREKEEPAQNNEEIRETVVPADASYGVPPIVPGLIEIRDRIQISSSVPPEAVPKLFANFDRKVRSLLEELNVKPTEDPDQDEHIQSTVTTGYRYAGRLIRPQQVILYQYHGSSQLASIS